MYSSLLKKESKIKELNILVGPNGSGKSTVMKTVEKKLDPKSTMWIKDLKPLLNNVNNHNENLTDGHEKV